MRVLTSLLYILFGLVAAYIILEVSGMVLHTRYPVIVVVSCSMYPELNRGDLVVVSGAQNYSPGDVIVYRSERKAFPIIHRVIEVRDGEVLPKGDNNVAPDGWIPVDRIYGKMVFKIPALGWPKILLMKLTGQINEPLELCTYWYSRQV